MRCLFEQDRVLLQSAEQLWGGGEVTRNSMSQSYEGMHTVTYSATHNYRTSVTLGGGTVMRILYM